MLTLSLSAHGPARPNMPRLITTNYNIFYRWSIISDGSGDAMPLILDIPRSQSNTHEREDVGAGGTVIRSASCVSSE